MRSFNEMGVQEDFPEDKIPLGKKVIKSRWVLVRRPRPKGIKARLVAQEIAIGKIFGWVTFAATPTMATLRMLFALSLTFNWQITLGDVSVAFLHAPIGDEMVLILPPANIRKKGFVWKLKKALYGLRTSPRRWQDFLV